MCDGTLAVTPTKLLITDLPNREHFDAEHKVANAILHFTSFYYIPRQTQQL